MESINKSSQNAKSALISRAHETSKTANRALPEEEQEQKNGNSSEQIKYQVYETLDSWLTGRRKQISQETTSSIKHRFEDQQKQRDNYERVEAASTERAFKIVDAVQVKIFASDLMNFEVAREGLT